MDRLSVRIAGAALVMLLPLLAAGKCDPQAPAPVQQPAHDPVVDQPGPQADPGTCVNRDHAAPAALRRAPGVRDVKLEAHWVSETKVPPVITWAHNGVVAPAVNVPEGHRDSTSARYTGEWSTFVQASCGDTVSVRIAGTRSATLAMCAITVFAQGPVKTGERGCEAHLVVP